METEREFCTVYLVRHGETEHNFNGIIQGQSDSPLTSQGQKQVRVLAEELRPIHFDALFSSDLGRARQTAEILKLERKLALNTTRLLREKFFGRYEGRASADFAAENRQLIAKFQSLSDAEKMKFKYEPSQENDEQTAGRMLTFLREVGAAYAGKTVLVVSHGSIMRSLLKHLGYAKYDELTNGTIENAGYIKLATDGVDFFIKQTKGVNKKRI